MSLPAADAQPTDLQDWIRRHRNIENRLHHIRDVTFREDQHQARTGTGPAVILDRIAVLRQEKLYGRILDPVGRAVEAIPIDPWAGQL
ncbi:hypothetical protein GCM10009827_118330 [Dactylosporangium maewongense]|uniref:Transposase n=1 Tax=Dactylosporangium maewongense TaxID=634393 RepID=A0ABN2DIP7_9ACTN